MLASPSLMYSKLSLNTLSSTGLSGSVLWPLWSLYSGLYWSLVSTGLWTLLLSGVWPLWSLYSTGFCTPASLYSGLFGLFWPLLAFLACVLYWFLCPLLASVLWTLYSSTPHFLPPFLPSFLPQLPLMWTLLPPPALCCHLVSFF